MKKSKALEFRRHIESSAALQDDSTALESLWMFPKFEDLIGKTIDQGIRFRYNGKLYKTRQSVVIQDQYPPSISTAALFVRIAENDAGNTADNPIPFEKNMELNEGKYYLQNGITYVCTRKLDACYWNLNDVVGSYVDVINTISEV